MRWIEQAIPEELPPLRYPAYADAVDKAQLELRAGRYRLAMQTLRLSDQIDSTTRILLIGEILVRRGEFADAIALLSQPQLEPNPIARRHVPAMFSRSNPNCSGVNGSAPGSRGEAGHIWLRLALLALAGMTRRFHGTCSPHTLRDLSGTMWSTCTSVPWPRKALAFA